MSFFPLLNLFSPECLPKDKKEKGIKQKTSLVSSLIVFFFFNTFLIETWGGHEKRGGEGMKHDKKLR